MKHIHFLALLVFFAPSWYGQNTSSRAAGKASPKSDSVKTSPTFNAALRDRSGNLWFGGSNGIFRFNADRTDHPCINKRCKHNRKIKQENDAHNQELARSFIRYTGKDGLEDIRVQCAYEDRSGKIWFGSADGAYYYDGKKFTHMSLPWSDPDFLRLGKSAGGVSSCNWQSFVRCIYEDKEGQMWFGTSGQGAYRLNNGTLKQFSAKDGLYSNVSCIREDEYGNLWFGTSGAGLFRYNISTGSFTNFAAEKTSGGYTFKREEVWLNHISSMLEDSKGTTWFGAASNGAVSYKGGSLAFLTSYGGKGFSSLPAFAELSYNHIMNMMEDRSGNIWFTTAGNGLYRYNLKSRSTAHFTTRDGLHNNFIPSILEDSAGNIWCGSSDGGLCRYDGRSFTDLSAILLLP